MLAVLMKVFEGFFYTEATNGLCRALKSLYACSELPLITGCLFATEKFFEAFRIDWQNGKTYINKALATE
jgi:hypothetical protein